MTTVESMTEERTSPRSAASVRPSAPRWTRVEVAPDRAGEMEGWRTLPDRLPDLRTVKDESITHIVAGRPPFCAGEVYVKFYHLRGLGRWRTFGLPSRAEREWSHLWRVARAGVPVTRPVAWGERSRFGLRSDCFIATESIPDAVPVKRLLGDTSLAEAPYRRRKTTLLHECGAALAGVHRAGLIHNRSSLKNYLWVPGKEQAIVCDLPYAFVTGGDSCHRSWWALGDLIELVGAKRYAGVFSRGDVYRTLIGYCGERSDTTRRLYRRFRRWQWLWNRRPCKEIVVGFQRLIGRVRDQLPRRGRDVRG